jgi:Dyp-type peroxidase family
MSPVAQQDVQGNILCGYGRTYRHGLFLFLRVDKPDAARGWLRERLTEITTALPWVEAPPATLNVAFTFEGLGALGVAEPLLDRFPSDFRQGMRERAALLGDVGPSDPDAWEEGLIGVHMLVTVSATGPEIRDKRADELKTEAQAHGHGFKWAQRTAVLGEEGENFGFEHFGFRDGISQPSIRDPNAGPWRRTKSDVPVEPGEFVLGYEDEGGTLPPAPPVIGANGSFLVVRKLEQDVDGFWAFIEEQAGGDPDRREWLAAKILGRWKDGTPLALSPDAPDPERAEDLGWLDDFTYAYDPEGLDCPIGAHIRRTNPRDSIDRDWRFTNRHRIIRRGMPYSPDKDEGEDKRGLMFACYQASIERQFEFVQSQWCGDGNAFGLGSDPDFIVGPEAGKMTIQGRPPTFVPMRRYIRTRGGDYFFAPGIAALGQIAGG